MDIFKFRNPTEQTKMEQGEIINNIKSKLWIERYRPAGEFKLVANVSTGLKEKLPIGSFISHVDTTEVMIVENHEISDNKGKESEIIVTGRGFETFLENRVVGTNKVFPATTGQTYFTLISETPWQQAAIFIRNHVHPDLLLDDNNAVPFVEAIHEVVGSGAVPIQYVKRGDVYTRLMELITPYDLGIKVVRPGPWSPLHPLLPTVLVIHTGVDRSSEIIYSYDSGEIESADYLWSNKKLKNAAVVSGRWVEVFVTNSEIEYDRRIMHVDASDVDNDFTSAPTGPDLTNIINIMTERGLQALANQNDVAITNAQVSKEAHNLAYRVDFNVGDIITVNGNYNETATRRISEYVEIEDETGKSGYPTLTMV